MTKENLYALLMPIVTDETLTQEQKVRQLASVAGQWFHEKLGPEDFDHAFDVWNDVMANIIVDYDLNGDSHAVH